MHPSIEVTEWILGSARRRFAAAPPVDDEAGMHPPIAGAGGLPMSHL